MNVLADLLAPGLRVVFCGTAVATASAARGHYYAGPSNRFWTLLHRAGFTPMLLRPEDDAKLLTLGLGVTDLVKHVAQSHDRGLTFERTPLAVAHIAAHSPGWVAFNGLTPGRQAARALGQPTPKLGAQPWSIGNSRVFVLPSSSGANTHLTAEDKLAWWSRLRALAVEHGS